MSQLNPNAAEFIPVSPTQVGSPVCMFLKEEDKVLAQSPKRPPPQEEVDINVPNPVEFEDEVKSKPSEVDEFDDDPQKQDGVLSSPIESLLNGKNIDDIPEFQPGSTPTKDLAASEEFHFGPKAAPAPFTPAKLLDHSENISTRAVFGDDTVTTLNDSCFSAHDNTDLASPLREQDPMSMSFHQDRDDPFGLNKVQELPADVDKFIESVDDSKLDDTISDLPEHEPLGAGQQENVQITDLDKDEELDLEEKVDLPKEETDLDNKDVELLKDFEVSKSPELACEYQKVPEESENITPTLSKGDIQAASPEPYPSKESESISPEPICDTPKSFEESKSPEPICDISSTQTPEPFGVEQVCDMPTNEVSDLVCQAPKSPEPIVSPQPENIQEEVTSSQIEDFCKFGSQPDVNIINEVEDQIKFVENKSDELVSEEGSAVACDSNVLNNLESPIPPVRETIPGEAEVLTDDDRHYLNIASPTEEVTSSIKDELSSPRIESPPAEYPIELEHPVESAEAAAEQVEHIIESTEHPVESTQHPVESAQCPIQPAEHPIAENLNFAQELSLATTEKEIVPEETSSPVFDQRIPDTCPISTPKSINERESVTTAEVNSFLDRSLLPDIESPLSPSNNTLQPQENSKEPNLGETQYDITDPSHPLSKCVYPLPPEVESIQEVVDEKPQPSAPLLEELPKEPVPEQDESFISKETVGAVSQLVEPSISKEETTGEVAATEATSGVAAAAGVAAAGAAVAAAALTADKKAKPKTTTAKKTLSKPSSPTKTPILKTSTPKTTPSRPSTGSKPPTKPLSKPPATTKPPASTTTLKANATKTAATRPKPSASTLLKSTDKKPMTNGEHKPLSSVKKTDSSLLSARSGTVSKTSLQPPKSTTKMSSNTSVGKTNGPSKLTSAPTAKPRPTTLSSARTNNVTKAASQTAPTSAKTNPSKSSSGTFPKTNTTTASKPKTTSAAAPKARVPLTRTVVSKTASPDVEKQTKESANKLTASRTATTTSRTGSASARTTTTLKKTEVKMNSTRSTTLASKSSTTSVTKSTTAGKKSTETASKTKVTKMEKPKENGISTVVTEQITLVNNAINETNGVGEEPHLIKDNSPIDNKLIVDTLIETNTAD